MRSTVIAPIVAAGFVQLASATNGCEANNCARAVTGTSYPTASVLQHKQDCSSAMQVTTVTPSAAVVTETVTETAPPVTEVVSTDVDVSSAFASTVTLVDTVYPAVTTTVASTVTTNFATITSTVATTTKPCPVTYQKTTTCAWNWGWSYWGWGKGNYHWKRDVAARDGAIDEAALDAGDELFQRLDARQEEGEEFFQRLDARTYDKNVTVPAGVPLYASACTDFAMYTTACSCWGITAATATASAPAASTETVTVTVTPTVSVVDATTTVIPLTATQKDTKTIPTTETVIQSITAQSTTTVYVTAVTSKTSIVWGPTCTKKEVVATSKPQWGGKTCSFNVYSNKFISPYGGKTSTCFQKNVDGCLNACNLFGGCNAFSFHAGSGNCNLHCGISGFAPSVNSEYLYGCLKAQC